MSLQSLSRLPVVGIMFWFNAHSIMKLFLSLLPLWRGFLGVGGYFVLITLPQCQQPPKTRKRQERFLPQRLWREHGPDDTLILSFQPQHCERITSCCFKPLSLQQFVMAELGNECSNPGLTWQLCSTKSSWLRPLAFCSANMRMYYLSSQFDVGIKTMTSVFQQQVGANTKSFIRKIPENHHRHFYFNLIGQNLKVTQLAASSFLEMQCLFSVTMCTAKM